MKYMTLITKVDIKKIWIFLSNHYDVALMV